jgi:hypothetical protein
MSIQPGRGQILGQDPQSNNPLLILAQAVERQTAVLAQIAENTKKEDRHTYAVDEVGEGSFMSYCLACSETAQRFIYPCEDPHKAPPGAPPSTFTIGGSVPRPPVSDILSGD